MTLKNKVFVYGILKDGSTPAILPNYNMLYRGCASIVASPGAMVVGELRLVGDKKLANFDLIEGVDNGYYHRMRVIVCDNKGVIHKAWVYQQLEDK